MLSHMKPAVPTEERKVLNRDRKPIIRTDEDARKLLELWNSAEIFECRKYFAPQAYNDRGRHFFSLPKAA